MAIPFRPDRPVNRDVCDKLLYRSRWAKTPNDVDIYNLHYRQLTEVIHPEKYFKVPLDRRFEGVQRLHAELWLNFFHIDGKPPFHYKTINRLATLTKRELRMKRTTAFRLILQRMIFALGPRVTASRKKDSSRF